MIFRQAVRQDLDAFLDHRMAFVQTVSEVEDISAFRAGTRDMLEAHMEKGDFIVFIGEDQDTTAVSCMACLFDTVPLPTCPHGKSAEVLGLFTAPAYRRQGHGERLLRLLLEELKARGVERVLLIYTEAGYPIYQKLGFQKVDNQMQLRLF